MLLDTIIIYYPAKQNENFSSLVFSKIN